MITHLYRYPVKGLTGEALETLELIAGEGIAGDRAVAISRQAGSFDTNTPLARPKTEFLMLARNEALAALDATYDETSDTLTLAQDGAPPLTASLATDEGRASIENFFKSYLGDETLTPQIVRAKGHKFTDVSVVSQEIMRAVSLINLNSIRALEDAIGQPVDLRRFRANIYFDHLPAWAELEWPGQNIQIGSACAKALFRTRRCAATQVNPDTAARDIDLPTELHKHFGHVDMGVYVEILSGAEVAIDDMVKKH